MNKYHIEAHVINSFLLTGVKITIEEASSHSEEDFISGIKFRLAEELLIPPEWIVIDLFKRVE